MNNGQKKMRVVAYCRVATQAQLNEDFALNAQSARLHQQAEREHLEIVGEVKVYEKGVVLDRPGWHNTLRLAAEQKADAILVTGADRVARSLPLMMEALTELDKRGLRLRTCDGDLPFTTGFRQYIL